MLNPLLAGFAQAGADATQNIATSMAKSQELQRQQKEHDDEKTATLAKFYLDNGMVTAAAPHLKKLYGDQFDDKHLATLQAEADQKKKIANLDQLKTIFDFTGGNAAKSQSLADSFGITVPTQKVTSTAQVPVVKATPEGRQFSPIKADGSPILAPLTTTKTASLFDLLKPKGDYELVKSADGAILRVDNSTGKYETLKPGITKTPATPRLVQDYRPDGTIGLVPATPGATIHPKPAAARTASGRSGGSGGGHGSGKPAKPARAAQPKVIYRDDVPYTMGADGKLHEVEIAKPETAFEKMARKMDEEAKRRRGGK